MKKNNLTAIFGILIVILTANVFAQDRAEITPVIFAVTDAGKYVEPIAAIEKGALAQIADSKRTGDPAVNFSQDYYQSNAVYDLIFGGAATGKVTIKSSNPQGECSKNLADVTVAVPKAKLSDWIMGLAVKPVVFKNTTGVRRAPTAAERAAVETLVRAEFAKRKVSANAAKNLKYYNLTALDVDSDGKIEIVGSYYADSSPKLKNMLFFIAQTGANGKYQFGYSDYAKITPADLMSGDMKDADALGGELLLDALDYDNDGTAEIFTIVRAFEGNNFHVYKRQKGVWTRTFESYNYHCAY